MVSARILHVTDNLHLCLTSRKHATAEGIKLSFTNDVASTKIWHVKKA